MSKNPTRFSQAQLLIAALFAVVFTGDVPIESPVALLCGESTKRSHRLNHSLYNGLQMRVAKSVGVSRSFVCRVMNGQKKSTRVSAALEKEFARIDREIERSERRAA